MQSMLSGLGSLPRKNEIPSDFQDLINAQKLLQQKASQVTPQGTPTVAAQMEQALGAKAQQAMAPQGMPAQGMPGMMPSDPYREQLMKTLQAQAQAQMQPQAQPDQSGIAQLPAQNMQGMKEGGIIGYAEGGMFGEYYNNQPTAGDSYLEDRRKYIVEREKDLRAAEQKQAPTPFTREQAYQEAEAAVPVKPWEQNRQGIEQLVQKNAAILQRDKDLYEQEKANRSDEKFMRFLSGAAKGVGGGGEEMLRLNEELGKRDAAFTQKLNRDMEFTKSLLDMSNSANEKEWNYNTTKALAKATDYEKAADIFRHDQQVLLTAIRGDLGTARQEWARIYAAENRPEARATNMESYAQGHLARQKIAGDDRPEAVILQEGRDKWQAANVAAAASRADTGAKTLDYKKLQDASEAARKRVSDASKNPMSPDGRMLSEARLKKDGGQALSQVYRDIHSQELRNRNINPSTVENLGMFGESPGGGQPSPSPAPSKASPTVLKFDSSGNLIK